MYINFQNAIDHANSFGDCFTDEFCSQLAIAHVLKQYRDFYKKYDKNSINHNPTILILFDELMRQVDAIEHHFN